MLRSSLVRIVAVGATIAALVSCAPKPDPSLVGPTSAVPAGSAITITGHGWGTANSGCATTVSAKAFVSGISPYGAIDLPRSTVDSVGNFQSAWQTPDVSESMKWTIEVTQACNGSSTLVRSIVIELNIR